MQDIKEEVNLEQKQSTTFIIGILIGLVSAIIIEILINFLEPYFNLYIFFSGEKLILIKIRWIIFILSTLILIYLISLWRRIMGISNYLQYDVIFSKKEINNCTWKRFYDIFSVTFKDKLRENKIEMFFAQRFRNPLVKYNRSYLITDFVISYWGYIYFFQDWENKKDNCKISCVLATKKVDILKKSVEETLDELSRLGLISNKSVLTPTYKIHITFWIARHYKTQINKGSIGSQLNQPQPPINTSF